MEILLFPQCSSQRFESKYFTDPPFVIKHATLTSTSAREKGIYESLSAGLGIPDPAET